jgi:hypothetical protein
LFYFLFAVLCHTSHYLITYSSALNKSTTISDQAIKTVDMVDFSSEHLSWLERRLGLRYLTGAVKAALDADLKKHLARRERRAREAALTAVARRNSSRLTTNHNKNKNKKNDDGFDDADADNYAYSAAKLSEVEQRLFAGAAAARGDGEFTLAATRARAARGLPPEAVRKPPNGYWHQTSSSQSSKGQWVSTATGLGDFLAGTPPPPPPPSSSSSSRSQSQRRRRRQQRRRRLQSSSRSSSSGDGPGAGGGVLLPRVVAVFPFFASNAHCDLTGAALAKASTAKHQQRQQQPSSSSSLSGSAEVGNNRGARCDSGSSAPEMRRFFLNLTFWSVHRAVTPHIALSTCSDDDEAFARRPAALHHDSAVSASTSSSSSSSSSSFSSSFSLSSSESSAGVVGSGLPFFDVLRSHCWIHSPEFDRVIFKPGLLGVLTLRAVQHRLRSDPRWSNVDYIFYNEADQVIHSRLSLHDLARATGGISLTSPSSTSSSSSSPFYVVPHRLQPISDPVDLPGLAAALNGSLSSGSLPRWVAQDVARVAAARRFHFHQNEAQGESSSEGSEGSESSDGGSCCTDRGECRTRNHWLPWKSPPKEDFPLAVMKLGDSLTMVAGEGDYGNLLFRACHPKVERASACPP